MHDSVKRLAVNFASAGALSNGAKPNAGAFDAAFNARDDAALDEFAAKADADFVSVGFAPTRRPSSRSARPSQRGLPSDRADRHARRASRPPRRDRGGGRDLVARGELGSVVAPEKMFAVQKHVLRMCERAGRPCVVTRLMDSMTCAEADARRRRTSRTSSWTARTACCSG